MPDNGEPKTHTLEYVLEKEEEPHGPAPGDKPAGENEPQERPGRKKLEFWVYSIFFLNAPDRDKNDEKKEEFKQLLSKRTFAPNTSRSIRVGNMPSVRGSPTIKVSPVEPKKKKPGAGESDDKEEKDKPPEEPVVYRWDIVIEFASVIYIIHYVVFVAWTKEGLAKAVGEIKSELKGKPQGQVEISLVWMGHNYDYNQAQINELFEILKTLADYKITKICWSCFGGGKAKDAGFDLWSDGFLHSLGAGGMALGPGLFFDWLVFFGVEAAIAAYNNWVPKELEKFGGEQVITGPMGQPLYAPGKLGGSGHQSPRRQPIQRR